MGTKHEAQQLAAIKRQRELDNQGAAVAIKRLRARVEELERALREIADEVGPDVGGGLGGLNRIGRIARTILTKE